MEKIKKLFEGFPANAAEYARKTFKIGVFGVKNNFVLAGILLIGYCVIAPAVFMTATMDNLPEYDMLPEYRLETLWQGMLIYSIIAAYVGGLLIAAVMFSYIHKRRDRDFFHSMPVKRGQYFIGYFGAGFVMFTVPYLLMCAIMGLLGGSIGIAFSFVFPTLALYVVIYSAVVFAMMFSGSLLSSIVTLGLFNTLPVVVIYCSLLISGGVDINAYMSLLAPYICVFTPLTGGYSFYEIFSEGAYYWVLWVQLGIAVIELVLSFIMYNLRKGETTMAVAFPKTRYFLQYGTMFIVALFCTSVFNDTIYYVYGGNTTASFSPEAVVWTAIMVFVTFVLMNMILEQNFRAAFHRIRHLFIFAGVYVVTVAVIVGIIGALPYWVVPIKTDAVLIRQEIYTTTYQKPDDEDYYANYGYGYDEEIYHVSLGEYYYVVTDPDQVAELTRRIYKYMNEREGEYRVRYDAAEGEEYYYTNMQLCTLKPGQKITEGMDVDKILEKVSQTYYVYFGAIPSEDMEYLTNDIKMIETMW